MSRYKVAGNSMVRIDNNLGTLTNLTSYVETISALGKEVDAIDVTAFADTAERVIAGIEKGQEFTIEGKFDDTATTGPDAVLAPLVGTLGTWEWLPKGTAAGSRKFSGEALCIRYTVEGAVKDAVKFSAVFKVDGTVIVGTA